ncbi:MAG: RNA polymerase sigma factor [Prevotella sp.]
MNEISFRNDILPLKNELYRLALRITMDRAEAEDIVQETLIKVWNRRGQWAEIASMEAFCLTICRNLSLDHMKRAGNKTDPIEESEAGEDESNPYEQMLMRNRVEIVRKLIDNLPEKQRTCIQLRDFEGKTYKDIAKIMAVTEEQVKVNIFRARQAIKQKFQKIEDYGL